MPMQLLVVDKSMPTRLEKWMNMLRGHPLCKASRQPGLKTRLILQACIGLKMLIGG